MSASRSVWILALGVLALVGSCAPGTAPSDSPPATEGAAGPSASVRAAEPLPLLIDTDVAPDDLVALAFLVSGRTVRRAASNRPPPVSLGWPQRSGGQPSEGALYPPPPVSAQPVFETRLGPVTL